MTDAVRLEWMPDSPVEWKSDGVLVTASEVRDVLTSSHIHCTWEVSRRGELNPCGKTAVAIRYDENNGGVTEVCKHHASRMLVPLTFIAAVVVPTPEGQTDA